jgi:hypothetical protein
LRRYRSIGGMPMQSSLAYLGQEPNTDCATAHLSAAAPGPPSGPLSHEPAEAAQPTHWAGGWRVPPGPGRRAGVKGLDGSGAPARPATLRHRHSRLQRPPRSTLASPRRSLLDQLRQDTRLPGRAVLEGDKRK